MIKIQSIENEIHSLYEELIASTEVYRNADSTGSYVIFGAIAGQEYQTNGVMVCGRSTNGWHRYDISTDNMFSGEQQLFDIPYKLTELKLTNTKSRLWKVLSIVFENIYGEDWEQRLIYSNFYKMAPDEETAPNGTPPYPLRQIQNECCKKILKKELTVFQPKHIIAFTGCQVESNFDISENLMDCLLDFYTGCPTWPNPIKTIIWEEHTNGKRQTKYAVEVYKLKDTYVYLCEHPDRKSAKKHGAALLELFHTYFAE